MGTPLGRGREGRVRESRSRTAAAPGGSGAGAGAHLGPDLGLAAGPGAGPRDPRAARLALGLIDQPRLELGQVALGARGAVAALVLLLAFVLEGQQLVGRAEVVAVARAAPAGVQLRHGALRPRGRGASRCGARSRPGAANPESGPPSPERGGRSAGGLRLGGLGALGTGRGRPAQPLRELAGRNIKGAAGGVQGGGAGGGWSQTLQAPPLLSRERPGHAQGYILKGLALPA